MGFCDRPGWDHESRLRVWTQLLGALEDQQRRDSLFSSLARPQRVSLEIVEEWWKEEKKYYPGSALQNWFYHAQGPRDEAKPPWMYRRRMFILWDREITPIEPDTGRSIRMQLAELEELRQLAATSAAAHRITLATFPDFTSQSSHLDHGTAGFIPDRISDPPISACVQPCAWLSKVQEHGYPYYLWDILEKKLSSALRMFQHTLSLATRGAVGINPAVKRLKYTEFHGWFLSTLCSMSQICRQSLRKFLLRRATSGLI